jgi:hypothetical protein
LNGHLRKFYANHTEIFQLVFFAPRGSLLLLDKGFRKNHCLIRYSYFLNSLQHIQPFLRHFNITRTDLVQYKL